MLEEIVLPIPWQVQLDKCEIKEGVLLLKVHIITRVGQCPGCDFTSGRVHSRYWRHPADLPITGRLVELHLNVRRFFCDNAGCPRRTFAEQVPVLLEPKARRTTRQACYLKEVAFALGGKPGARLALKQGVKVGRDTLLRLLRKTPILEQATPRILGVEYGTILVDLEQHRPVDLLLDRKAETLVKWLEKHPGVEIISRDRASSYADGARRGAPQAIQVADRFHLVKNLDDHLKNMFERKNACLLAPQVNSVSQQMLAQAPFQLEPAPVKPGEVGVEYTQKGTARDDEKQPEAAQAEAVLSRKGYVFQSIHELGQAGLPMRVIARELKVSRQTVRKFLKAHKIPRYTPRPQRFNKLDIYRPYIAARWREGICKGIQLFLEIKERGYEGSWSLVGQYLASYRLENPAAKPVKAGRGRGRPPGIGLGWDFREGNERVRKVKPQPLLSAREAVWIMLKKSEDRSEKQQNLLRHLRAFDAEVEAAYQLSVEFMEMLRERQGHKLEEWLAGVEEEVRQEQLPELSIFANGIRQDFAAVQAGLTLEVSQGQVEGQVNRLKTIKRKMYGRSKFDLLKARVLHRTAAAA